MDNSLQIFSAVSVLIVCILGIIGNILSGIILLRKKLHSSTSYLLFGLAICDLFLLILSFCNTLGRYPWSIAVFPYEFHTIKFFWDWICTGGTKYYTVAVSFERYLAVCHPFLAKRFLISNSHGKYFAIGVGIFLLLLATTSYFYSTYAIQNGFDLYVAIILHFLPFLLLLILNIRIYFGMRTFMKSHKHLTRSESKEISITRMLLCVVVVYGCCYSFEFIRRIMRYVSTDVDNVKYGYYDYVINHLADFGYVLNSSVNFIIYVLLVPTFRTEFYKLLSILSPIQIFNSLSETSSTVNNNSQNN